MAAKNDVRLLVDFVCIFSAPASDSTVMCTPVNFPQLRPSCYPFIVARRSVCVLVAYCTTLSVAGAEMRLGLLPSGDTNGARLPEFVADDGRIVANDFWFPPVMFADASAVPQQLLPPGASGGVKGLASNGTLIGGIQTDEVSGSFVAYGDGRLVVLTDPKTGFRAISKGGLLGGTREDDFGDADAVLFDAELRPRVIYDPGPGSSAWVSDLNDRGDVIVRSVNTTTLVQSTRLWRNGVWSELTLNGAFFEPRDINNLGQIIGYTRPDYSAPGSDFVSYLLNPDGSAVRLNDAAGGTVSAVWAINDLGQIVGTGHVANGSEWSALLWDAGQVSPRVLRDDAGLTTEPDFMEAYDINNSGQIVGSIRYAGGPTQGYSMTQAPEPTALLISSLAALSALRRVRR